MSGRGELARAELSQAELSGMLAGAARRRFSLTPWYFLGPSLLILLVFNFYPIFCGVSLAFTEFSLLRHTQEGELVWPRFVGLENFFKLWVDPYFWKSLANSLKYMLVVPIIQVLSIAIAVLVDKPFRGRQFFRTAFYIPVITSVVVVGITWKWVFRSDGLANYLLSLVGVEKVGWLTDPDFALYSIMFVTLWQGLGYYMILYLAGLQSIPPELEEAARIDGAGTWDVFWHITVPMLKPTVALCTIISCISALKVFGEIFVMTPQGGPNQSTLTMVYYLYQKGFEDFDMGYSAAVALVLAAVVGVISWINVRFFKEGGLTSYG
jgi:putative chitobiose transport system permease protein